MSLTKVIAGMTDDSVFAANKNVIINGNFDIWQRGTSGFGVEEFSADRWKVNTNTDDTISISRQAFTTGQTDVPNEPEFFLRSALTAGSTGTVNDFRHRVEDVRTFAGETVTLSYYVMASVGFTQTKRKIRQFFGTGGSGIADTFFPDITLTTSWQRFTDTITLPSISGKTIAGGDDHLNLILGLPVNTTTTVDIAQVQLEKGSVATEFERRSIATELAMAQRYYEKSYDLSAVPGTVDALGAEAFRSHGTNHLQPVRFKIRKRRPPTMIAYNPSTGSSGTWRDNNAGEDRTITFAIIGETGVRVSLSSSVDLNTTSGHWTADAEF